MKKKDANVMSRRAFLKASGVASTSLALGGCGLGENFFPSGDDLKEFVQRHFNEMRPGDIDQMRQRLLKRYKEKYGRDFVLGTEAPMPNVMFAYGLDLSRCIGCRRCVYACVQENNQSRRPEIQWIRVLRFKKGDMNFEESEHYYDAPVVPEEGYYYMPVQCQQCENPPCVKVCPTKATWKDADGIVSIDYNWCIGCRYCMAACPYWARRFNFAEPEIPREQINTNLHYLGNRPRMAGVVEKCTFCVQRTRRGRYPACVEVCPVGARKFGNILDPNSEISHVIERQRVFRLKEDLNTQSKFYYFFSI